MSISRKIEGKRWLLDATIGLLAALSALWVSAESAKGAVWVANESGDSITVIDAATNKGVKSIAGIMGPHNVQLAPDGKTVWVTSGHTNEVVVIDAETYELRGRVPVGSEPAHVVLTPDGTVAYVSNKGDNGVAVIDTAAMKVLTTIPVGSGFGNGAFYYTANEGGSISKVDALSNTLIKSIKLDGVVHNAQISPKGDVLGAVLIPKMASQEKMGEMAGAALFFNTKNDQLIIKVTVGNHPAHIVFTQNGKYVLVTNNENNSVSVIDAKTYKVIQSVTTGKGPHGLRVSKDSHYAYIANMEEDTVSVINLFDLKEERRIKVGKTPVTTGITSDGKTLAVTLNAEDSLAIVDLATDHIKKIEVGYGPAQLFLEPDDKFIFVANQGTEARPSNTVSKIDIQTKSVIATIVVGKGAHGIVTDNTGKFVYVTNMFDNTVSVIDNGKNRVIATVPVGQTPNGITYKD